MARAIFSKLFLRLTAALDRRFGWHRLPLPLGIVVLIGIRRQLRRQNLYDTGGSPPAPSPPPPTDGEASATHDNHNHHLTARTIDGRGNDLARTEMGAAGSRFGRNVPLPETFPEPEALLLSPNPRLVSRELLTRDRLVPAESINVLAAAWLQFMIRDWFSHGHGPRENPWRLPRPPGDDWPEDQVTIPRTPADPDRAPGEAHLPPTYRNLHSHWWDGSQLYGNDAASQDAVRSHQDGKLKVGPDGLIPVDPRPGKSPAEEPGFWLGIALLQTLFAREHNAVCDRLRAEYPDWSDDDLFAKARLVTSALLAKIHTVEWTTAILGHPTMQIAMRANWWGLAGERINRLVGRLGDSEVLSGIPGSETDHFDVPYALTEEFVAVYRMHPLIPDDYEFCSAKSGALIETRPFPRLAAQHALDLLDTIAMPDLLYSFGIANPGQIRLHNFPQGLQTYERPDGFVQDLAATDILRTRELGVPRYNRFRELLHLEPARTFEEMTSNKTWADELRRVYDGNVDRVDTMVGMYAEEPPKGLAFSDTAFRIFALMASRRLNSDRFFTTDYTPRVYTQVGFDWIAENDMASVLLRHHPGLAPALRGVKNSFAPWTKVAS